MKNRFFYQFIVLLNKCLRSVSHRVFVRGCGRYRVLGVLCYFFVSTAAAQTCVDYIPNDTPNTRYTVGANQETVLDTQTNLTWLRCSIGQTSVGDSCTGTATSLTWQGALQAAEQANSVNLAGYNDWRVPNIKELASLVALHCFIPSINTALFPNTASSSYWSSSPLANDSDNAWFVDFSNGNDDTFNRSNFRRVRLVR